MTEDWDEKIDMYLEGTLSEAERKNVAHAIENDPLVEEMYQDHLLVRAMTKKMGKDDLINSLKELDKGSSDTNKKTTSTFSKKWWLIVIALTGLIIAGTFIKRLSELEPSMVAMEYAVSDKPIKLRGENATNNMEIEYFTPMKEGQEYLRKKEYKKARDAFRRIQDLGDVMKENKEWMIALTHYAESGKNHPVFKTTLNRITANPEHNAYKKALALETKINSFWQYFKK